MPESGKAQKGSEVGPDPCQREDKRSGTGLLPRPIGRGGWVGKGGRESVEASDDKMEERREGRVRMGRVF